MDPKSLMETMGPHLHPDGSLRESNDNVRNFFKMMDTPVLVARVLMICILKSTEKEKTLSYFMEIGGWKSLHSWLNEGNEEEDFAFLKELLELYLHLPVTLKILQSNSTPKLIKKISIGKDPRMTHCCKLARDLIKKWTKIINKQNGKEANPEPLPVVVEKKPVVVQPQPVKRKKSKTVKVPPSNSRSTGLLDEVPKVSNKRKAEEKKATSIPVKKFNPPENLHSNVSALDAFNPIFKAPLAKPKPLIQESNSFMDAISNPVPLVNRIKKKPRKPVTIPMKPMDTQQKAELDRTSPKPYQSPRPSSSPKELLSPHPNSSPNPGLEKQADGKKRVSWAPEAKLRSYQYFALDDKERANMSKVSWDELKRKELLTEHDHFKKDKKTSFSTEDRRNQLNLWTSPPPLIALPPTSVEPGSKSREKVICELRCQQVLKVFYFKSESIPSSPAEPETQNVPFVEPKIIPLEQISFEETADDSNLYDPDCSIESVSKPDVEPAPEAMVSEARPVSQPPSLSLPANVASFLSKIANSDNEERDNVFATVEKLSKEGAIVPPLREESSFPEETEKVFVAKPVVSPQKPSLLGSPPQIGNVSTANAGSLIPPPSPVNMHLPPPPMGFPPMNIPPPATGFISPPGFIHGFPPPLEFRPGLFNSPPPNMNTGGSGTPQRNNDMPMNISKQPRCRFFSNLDGCRNGNNCKFAHELDRTDEAHFEDSNNGGNKSWSNRGDGRGGRWDQRERQSSKDKHHYSHRDRGERHRRRSRFDDRRYSDRGKRRTRSRHSSESSNSSRSSGSRSPSPKRDRCK